MKRIGHNSKVGTVLLTDRRDFIPMDRSAYSQKLTNFGSTWQLDGRDYDGTDDYIDCGNAASLNNWTTFTFEAGANTPTTSANRFIISKQKDTSAVGEGTHFRFNNLGTFNLRIYNGAGDFKDVNSTALLINVRHRLVGVYNGTTIILYINGVSGTPVSAVGFTPNTTNNLNIGKMISDGFYNGTIASPHIKNYAEYAARIQRGSMIGGLRGRDGMRRTGG